MPSLTACKLGGLPRQILDVGEPMKLDPLILTDEQLRAQREARYAMLRRERARSRKMWLAYEIVALAVVIALAGIAIWQAAIR